MTDREFLKKLDIRCDIQKIRTVMEDVYELFGDDNVILVNSHANSKIPLKDFSGWLPDDINEDDFTTINEEFRDTAFEEFLHQLPFPYRRARLMRLGKKTCLTIHNDTCLRYHLAIKTNPACFLVQMDGRVGTFHHVPADGYLYEMDGTQNHTAINASKEERIHLVISSTKFDHLEERRPEEFYSPEMTRLNP
jgi:hypothetical protein